MGNEVLSGSGGAERKRQVEDRLQRQRELEWAAGLDLLAVGGEEK